MAEKPNDPTHGEKVRREETLAEMGAQSGTRVGSQPDQTTADIPGKPEPPRGDLPQRGEQPEVEDEPRAISGPQRPVDPSGPRPPMWE